MYAVTSIPFVNRTRATFRSAELGFFGVVVYTLVQTPLFCGLFWRAGDLLFHKTFSRLFRINWFIVGNQKHSLQSKKLEKKAQKYKGISTHCQSKYPEKTKIRHPSLHPSSALIASTRMPVRGSSFSVPLLEPHVLPLLPLRLVHSRPPPGRIVQWK